MKCKILPSKLNCQAIFNLKYLIIKFVSYIVTVVFLIDITEIPPARTITTYDRFLPNPG